MNVAMGSKRCQAFHSLTSSVYPSGVPRRKMISELTTTPMLIIISALLRKIYWVHEEWQPAFLNFCGFCVHDDGDDAHGHDDHVNSNDHDFPFYFCSIILIFSLAEALQFNSLLCVYEYCYFCDSAHM